MKTMEDFAQEHDLDFIDSPTDEPSQPASQPSQPTTQAADAGEGPAGKKRAFESTPMANESTSQNPRRSKKPWLREVPDIRKTLSELIDEPVRHFDDEDEEDNGHDENDDRPSTSTTNARRTAASTSQRGIIDRIQLKRASSSSLSSASGGRQAFSIGNSNNSSFKAPSLLRRATTNLSNASDTGVTSGAGGASSADVGKETVRLNGSKRSSVNFYAREQERKAKVHEAERARRESQQRLGRMRREKAGLGSLAGGSFG